MKYIFVFALQLVSLPALAAITTTFSNNNLTIESDADDAIVVTGLNEEVLINGQSIINATVLTANVHFITINGGPGNNLIDTTAVSPANGFTWNFLSVSISGRDGDDTIIAGPVQSTLNGGVGTDSLTGGESFTGFVWGSGEGGSDTIDGSLCTYASLNLVFSSGDPSDHVDMSLSAQMKTALFSVDAITVSATSMSQIRIFATDGDNNITFNDLSSLMLDTMLIYPGDGTDVIDASNANTAMTFDLQGSNFNSIYLGSSSDQDSFIFYQNIPGGSTVNFSKLNDQIIFDRTDGIDVGTAKLSGVENISISTGRGVDLVHIEDLSGVGLHDFFLQTFDDSDVVTMVGSAGVAFEINADSFNTETGVTDQLTVDAEMNTVTESPGEIQIGGKGLIKHTGFETVVINNQGEDLKDLWVME